MRGGRTVRTRGRPRSDADIRPSYFLGARDVGATARPNRSAPQVLLVTSAASLLERDRAYLWHPYTQMSSPVAPLPVVRGDGVYLFTEDGRRILDGISSWWVNIHGHCHPKLNQALIDQARDLEHVMFAGCTHRPAVDLAERLVTLLPEGLTRVF